MKKYRWVLTGMITCLLLAALGERLWQAVQQVREAARPPAASASQARDLGMKNFTLQAKAMVGALEAIKAYEPASAERQAPPPSWVRQFANTWLQSGDRGSQIPGMPVISPGLLQRQYILANHLGLRAQADGIWRALTDGFQDVPADDQRVNRILAQGYREAFKPGQTLAPEEIRLVRSKLGWFGELFAADLAQAGGRQRFTESKAHTQAVRAYGRIMRVTALFSFAGILGVLALLWALWLLKTKTPAFFTSPIPGFYFLEIFGLYFGGMFLLEIAGLKVLPAVLPGVSGLGRMLLLNIGGLSVLLLSLFWPALFKLPFGSIRKAVGLSGAKLTTLVADVGLGLVGFAAAMPLVVLALLVNFYLLSALGLDMTAGMHPLIPVLLKTKDPATLALALFLAAGIAPVVEESMFRGALFAWLRGRLQAWPAILVSAVVFAAVHPQGIFGFLPILVIGCVLALLREWRHRLWSSMVTHACVNAGTFLLAVSLFAD